MEYYQEILDIYIESLSKKLKIGNQINQMSRIEKIKEIKIKIGDKNLELNNLSEKNSLEKLIKKIHYFKKTDLTTLPRVVEIIKILKSLEYEIESLVDFGSQRGALLFPLMDKFPQFNFTGIDFDDEVKEFYQCLESLPNFNFIQANLENLKPILEDKSVDIVIASEIFEHIQDYQKAIDEAFRIARKYIIVTVPNHPDDNPEHINYFTKEDLEKLFNRPEKDVISCKITSGRIYNLVKIKLQY